MSCTITVHNNSPREQDIIEIQRRSPIVVTSHQQTVTNGEEPIIAIERQGGEPIGEVGQLKGGESAQFVVPDGVEFVVYAIKQ